MITHLFVSNYRSLGRDVKLRLARLAVLIGPNGSGKSNALDALSFVRDAVLLGLPAAITQRGGIDTVRRRSHGHPFNVRIELQMTLASGPAVYGFEITGDRQEEYKVKSEWGQMGAEVHFRRDGLTWSGPNGLSPRLDEQALAITALGGDARFKSLVAFLSQLTVYAVFPDTLRAPQAFDPSRPMRRHGENWVSVLKEMVRSEEKSELIAGLNKLTGDIEDTRVTSAAGYLIAEFKQVASSTKSKKWFNASQQSDGTLRVAGLLTALLQRPALPIIGVEEPELTVHPGALPMLYDYLAQASQLSQILITTHSPVLLDSVDPERDAVLVVDRQGGETRIERAGAEDLEPVKKRLLSLGDLLLTGDLQTSLFGRDEG